MLYFFAANGVESSVVFEFQSIKLCFHRILFCSGILVPQALSFAEHFFIFKSFSLCKFIASEFIVVFVILM